MNGALILAAGKGSRFGSDGPPKQFLTIRGKSVLLRAIEPYLADDIASKIVVVVSEDGLDQATSILEAQGIGSRVDLCLGGVKRQDSIRAGVDMLQSRGLTSTEDVIILHNAASPNTDRDTIRRCLKAVNKTEVAQACQPEMRTLFQHDGAYAQKIIARETTVCSVDPTVYPAGALLDVLNALESGDYPAETTTDIAMELGYRVALVESPAGNLKLTGPWDLAMLTAAIRSTESEEDAA